LILPLISKIKLSKWYWVKSFKTIKLSWYFEL